MYSDAPGGTVKLTGQPESTSAQYDGVASDGSKS